MKVKIETKIKKNFQKKSHSFIFIYLYNSCYKTFSVNLERKASICMIIVLSDWNVCSLLFYVNMKTEFTVKNKLSK